MERKNVERKKATAVSLYLFHQFYPPTPAAIGKRDGSGPPRPGEISYMTSKAEIARPAKVWAASRAMRLAFAESANGACILRIAMIYVSRAWCG